MENEIQTPGDNGKLDKPIILSAAHKAALEDLFKPSFYENVEVVDDKGVKSTQQIFVQGHYTADGNKLTHWHYEHMGVPSEKKALEFVAEAKANARRAMRDELLKDVDTLMQRCIALGCPFPEDWKTYRQFLLDAPSNDKPWPKTPNRPKGL